MSFFLCAVSFFVVHFAFVPSFFTFLFVFYSSVVKWRHVVSHCMRTLHAIELHCSYSLNQAFAVIRFFGFPEIVYSNDFFYAILYSSSIVYAVSIQTSLCGFHSIKNQKIGISALKGSLEALTSPKALAWHAEKKNFIHFLQKRFIIEI